MSETTIIRNDLHRSELAVANGVASLDGSGKIPGSQISTSAIINDSGSTSTDIWSASKTQTQINSAVVGLLDDRGNFTPSGNYPTTGGSGTAGAILKGDIWQISGLGAGVSALMGTRVVFDGDWVRALNDTPGQTDANWSESVTSSSNLGNANLVQTGNARTYTLPTGLTAFQYLEFDNFGGGNLLKLIGNNSVDFGSTSNGISANFYLKTGSDTFNIYGANDTIAHLFYGNYNSTTNAHYWQRRANGADTLHLYNYDDGQYLEMKGDNTNLFSMRSRTLNHGMTIETIAGYAGLYSFTIKGYKTDNTPSMFLRGNDSGGFYAFGAASTEGSYRMEIYGATLIKGGGSTSATTAALFQNSSAAAILTLKDDLTSIFGGIVTAPQVVNTPATITVTSNAGTVTRANRINNFTNSSAAAMTITLSTTSAADGEIVQVRVYDFSAVAQTITWVNTENSTATAQVTSNGSTTLPVTALFQYNAATSKWRCIATA